MNDWVEIGKVGKPHGFRGEFVLWGYEGKGELFKNQHQVLALGLASECRSSHRIEKAAWMPKGWKLKLLGIDTDAQVKAAQGVPLLARRSDLPPLAKGEFYVSDIVGYDVIDSEKGARVGEFIGTEQPAPHLVTVDRWWIRGEEGEFSIPALTRYIQKIDSETRQIHLQNLSQLV